MRWRTQGSRERDVTLPEAAGFEAVVLPHLDAAYNLARWLVRDPSLAQDVVQDATLRGLTGFRGFRGGDGRAWLLRIVRNVAYDMLASRAAPAGDETEAADVPDPADTPEAALLRRESLDQLAGALAALPLELRECLVLRELEELSYKEIAQVTGQPIGTVMSRLWRARQALLRGKG
ncbi:MAG TPA: sigma-70 family RNA polymerase sigma factor [Acetobacteraceae bacterium]|nr:sigma-70 family RNA polymerase sigma factor [Acetobacteraceae bacterium]